MEAFLAQWTQAFAPFFVNPALVVPGAALALSPVIIHLINRLRFRRVRFAAMEFLLQSQKRNRRRILIEQLLLLLLRVLIVLAIMLLLARLVLNEDQLAILTGNKAHQVVLIDDSGSMRDQWADTSAFGQALDVVRKIVAEGARRPNTQKLSVYFLSDLENPVAREQDVNTQLVTELETELENRECSHQALSLAAGLEEVGELFARDMASVKFLHVVSDFRQRDWAAQKALSTMLRTLDQSEVTINLVRTIDEPHGNLAVTELTGDVHAAASGVPVRLRVAVRNYGEQMAEDVRVSVFADDRKLPFNIVFDEIPAGDEVVREKDIAFEAGHHSVHVELEADALLADNARYLAFEIAPQNPVLIIDGDRSGYEGQFIADALAANPELTGYQPLIETPDYLARHPLDGFQCVYMVNVSQLDPASLNPLVDYVAQGGGLAWFVGPAVDVDFYNTVLRDEKGLFPVPLSNRPAVERPVDDGSLLSELTQGAALIPGPDLQFTDHPLFELYAGQDNPFVEIVKVDNYLRVAEEWEPNDNRRADGVTTLVRLRNGDPLVLEHRFVGRAGETLPAATSDAAETGAPQPVGEDAGSVPSAGVVDEPALPSGGRVVTFLTTAGPSWNNWARNPSYVITQLELEKYIARRDGDSSQRIVGEPVDIRLDAADYSEEISIFPPRREPVMVKAARSQAAVSDSAPAATETPSGGSPEFQLSLTYRDTDQPGVYGFRVYDHSREPELRTFAYNAPLQESELALMTPAELRKSIGPDVQLQIHDPGTFDWIEGKDAGQEVRQFLLILLLAFLIAEQLLAYRLSYHFQPAGATA